jgi:membrane fusion protein, adhesin transport system
MSVHAVRSFEAVGASRAARALSTVLTLFFVVAAVALVVTPWQQNVPGKGRVVAFSPVDRSQPIQAPVDGRVVRWEIVEGSRVRRGDVLAEMADNDPEIMRRMTDERIAVAGTLEAALRKGDTVERKIGQIVNTREQALVSLRARIESAAQRVRGAEQALIAAEAAHVTAKLNYDRQQLLAGKGLASTRMVELARLEFDRTAAEVDRAKAGLEAERNDRLAVAAEYERVNADYAAKIEEARGEAATVTSDTEKSRAELTKVDVRLARQATQLVRAPADGTVLRVFARAGGDMLKQGATIAILVP